MLYYSTKNSDMLNVIESFCKKTAIKKINIQNVKNFTPDNSNIFFIPIYGEEELSEDWKKFLEKYANDPCNIGTSTFFYLYGVYDLEIDKNITIIKQINHILKFLSVQINIFPLKIMTNFTPIESLVYYYNHANIKKINSNSLINKVIFFSKQELMQNNLKIVDFTAKIDGYSSVIDIIELKKKRKFLTKLISSLECESIILNRVKNINMDKVLKKAKNNKICKLQLKSNKLKNTESFSSFSSLEVLNLTANSFSTVNMDDFPNTIKSLNISKNYIKTIKVKQVRQKIKKLILFNNKITDMSFLIKFPNIEYLNIGLNPIKKFPDIILKLKKLEHLNISFVDIDIIPNDILKLERLKSIDLTGSKIKNKEILLKLFNNGVKVIS